MDLVTRLKDYLLECTLIMWCKQGSIFRSPTTMSSDIRLDALQYHSQPRPGKMETLPCKPCFSQRDLTLAYSPGVAEPCLRIKEDPSQSALYTGRSNLVGVITNGTAVLGLGNIGPDAAKPVMEGKGLLFKVFADIDVFDIELNIKEPEKLIEVIKTMEPTFGAINLEDIKAPECFMVEERLREEMDIPVFHDDQHGTAVISGAALLNAAEWTGRKLEDLKVVVVGAGAAGISCAKFYMTLGVRREHIYMFDSKGLIHTGRIDLHATKAQFSQSEDCTLEEALTGADVFLGLSTKGHGETDVPLSHHLRLCEPGPGNHLPGRQKGAPGLHHGFRPFRLAQPGEQRLLLPVHFPRRSGCARLRHQRTDENRRRARFGGPGEGTRSPGSGGHVRRRPTQFRH